MAEYSDSPSGLTHRYHRGVTRDNLLTLAVDGGSPLSSVAVGAGGSVLAATEFASGSSGPLLLERIHASLESAGLRAADVERMIATRGPGSFTGLRAALATILGLQQALGVPATAVSSFRPLAAQADPPAPFVAAIDALRGEWFVQPFSSPDRGPLEAPRIIPAASLIEMAPCRVVGFGVDALSKELPEEVALHVQEAKPLAPMLLLLALDKDLEWDAANLCSPLYLRPVAAVATHSPQRGL